MAGRGCGWRAQRRELPCEVHSCFLHPFSHPCCYSEGEPVLERGLLIGQKEWLSREGHAPAGKVSTQTAPGGALPPAPSPPAPPSAPSPLPLYLK